MARLVGDPKLNNIVTYDILIIYIYIRYIVTLHNSIRLLDATKQLLQHGGASSYKVHESESASIVDHEITSFKETLACLVFARIQQGA